MGDVVNFAILTTNHVYLKAAFLDMKIRVNLTLFDVDTNYTTCRKDRLEKVNL